MSKQTRTLLWVLGAAVAVGVAAYWWQRRKTTTPTPSSKSTLKTDSIATNVPGYGVAGV